MDGSISQVIDLFEPAIGSAAGLFQALVDSIKTLSAGTE